MCVLFLCFSELKMYKVELVKKETSEAKLKEASLKELADEWKRNVALKALLETLEVYEFVVSTA